MTTTMTEKCVGRASFVLMIAAAVSLLAACSRQDGDIDAHLDGSSVAQQQQAPRPGQAVSAEQAAVDAAISAEIKAKFAADSTLGPLGIEVRTREGLVELVGKAPDTGVRDHATRVAATVKNVLSVDNHMAVPRG